MSFNFPYINRLNLHLQEVVKGAAVAFSLRIVGVGLGFVFNIVLARMLGARGVGIFYLSFTTMTVATVIGRMGLDHALLRHSASRAAAGDWKQVAGIYRQGIKLALTASTVSSLLMFIFAPWISGYIFKEPGLTLPIRFMAFGVIPFSLFNLHGELLRSLKKIGFATFVQEAGVFLIALIILLILYLGNIHPGVPAIAFIYALASVGVLFLGILFWRQSVPHIMTTDKGSFDRRTLLLSSMPLFWVSFMNLVMGWTDRVILGVLGDSSEVGLYTVALRTAGLTSFILVALNSIAAPKFSALYSQGKIKELTLLARQSTMMMTLIAAPVLLIFIVWPEYVLGLFGPEFKAASIILAILAAGHFVNVVTGSVGYLLKMTGHERLVRNNTIFCALLNVGLNVILIPHLGIYGAAISTAGTMAVKNLISFVLVYKRLGFLTLPSTVRPSSAEKVFPAGRGSGRHGRT